MRKTKYTVKYTTAFKKDYKRAIKRGLKIELLEQVVALLGVLRFLDGADKLVHNVAERGKIVVAFQTIHAVVDGDQSGLPIRRHR
ncbi:hypothetical protein BHK98_08985 [Hornefia porci]|uniref:Uncharacterized protein n=1 Tax=Hornefia porci TaxID=2652292 RepID=A0A1Q9JIZ5_9FIRM|nr:hypothetical protein BHK98_08985 [Hornefia porci]